MHTPQYPPHFPAAHKTWCSFLSVSMTCRLKRRQSSDFRRIHNYLVGDPIATGSFAQIRRSLTKSSYRDCVTKLISKSKMARHSCEGVDIFTSELCIGPMLRHPSIFDIRDSIETRTVVIQGLDFYKNGDLVTYLEDNPDLSEQRRLTLLSQVLSALEFLHSYQICHRDVKPENVLIDDKGHARLCDFGFVACGVSCRGKCGSVGFAAPEVLSAGVYDGCKADVYSFGVLAYCMFTDNGDPEHIDLKLVPPAVAALVKACVQGAGKRPTVAELRRFECFEGVEVDEAERVPNMHDLVAPIENPRAVGVQRLSEIYQVRRKEMMKWLLCDGVNELKGLYYLIMDAREAEGLVSDNNKVFSQSLPLSMSLDSGFMETYSQCTSVSVKMAAFEVHARVAELLFSNNFCISTKLDGTKVMILNTNKDDVTFEMYAEDSEVDGGCWVCFQYNDASEAHVSSLVSYLKEAPEHDLESD